MIANIPGITLLGLGPGDPDMLTQQARRLLAEAGEIYLRTRHHPVVATLPPELILHSFDDLYAASDRFEDVYAGIVARILELGASPEGVIYAVPGHPFVAEATCPEIYRQAREANLPVQVVAGLSFLEPAFTALDLDPFPQVTLIDALELAVSYYPVFPPDAPALIAQVYDRDIAAQVKLTLMEVYPDDHPVALLHAAGTADEFFEQVALYEIDRSSHIGLLTCLYVPPLPEGTSLEAFADVVAHLRAPEGCPWDRKQTIKSLRPHLLEEAYEALSAIDAGEMDELQEELGDLLLMVLMLAQIASEEEGFNFTQVVHGIYTKIVRRHPHVFGDMKIQDEAGVLVNWEKLKELERKNNGDNDKGLLDGVARALPALLQAQEIQGRAARVGFDWQNAEGVLEKIEEELQELQTADQPEQKEAELGDLLFALANFARHLELDAEAALRGTIGRFRRRFKYIEVHAAEQDRSLSEMSLAEMDQLWDQAKEIDLGESG